MYALAQFLRATVTALCLLAAAAATAETVTYEGSGTYVANRTLLPLGNGGAAVIVSNSSVATFEASESGFIFGECAGLGLASVSGTIKGTIICTFSENDDNSIDITGVVDGDEVSADVIGGSGKWKGSTGSGVFNRKFEDGPRGSYTYTLTISVP